MQEPLYCSFHVLLAPELPKQPAWLVQISSSPTPSLPLLHAVSEGAEGVFSIAVGLIFWGHDPSVEHQINPPGDN